MTRRMRSAWASALLFGGLAIALAGCGSSDKAKSKGSDSDVQTVHVITAKPHTETLDFPPKGKSPGDVYVFDATILAADGRTILGQLRGTQIEIRAEHGVETVQGMLTFQFGPGDEIVIGGLSAYPRTGTGLIKGKAFVRPVLGGTGKYAGARGTVTSQQLAGGRYDQVFRLTY